MDACNGDGCKPNNMLGSWASCFKMTKMVDIAKFEMTDGNCLKKRIRASWEGKIATRPFQRAESGRGI